MRQDISDLIRRMSRDLKAQHAREYPAGRLCADDEGGISGAVGSDTDSGKVLIVFAGPVTWTAMGPDEADRMASALVTHAKRVRDARRNGGVQ